MSEVYRFPAVALRPDEYLQAKSVEEVTSILKKYGEEARIVGAGITLHELGVMGMLSGVKKLVDIQQLGLDYVESSADVIRVGASTPVHKIRDHDLFKREPALRAIGDASDFVPIQIVNTATIAGQICTGLPILSLPTALLAVDASVKCVSSEGERLVPLNSFYVDYFLTDLKPEEFVTEVQIPKQPGRSASAFKYEKLSAADYPLGSVGTRLALDEQGKCQDCRVATGSLGRTPMRVKKVEESLLRSDLDSQTLAKAGEILSKEIDPISDLRASADYRRKLARALFKEAAEMAISRIKR
jgi:carbon-monoxide dehydrogenase medium subunit